jgi:hypothetical protein
LDSASLQHIRERKSTHREVSGPRYVPPSGFDYPRDGLLLPNPCRPYFVPAALMRFRPSEFSPLARRSMRLRNELTHMPFHDRYRRHRSDDPSRSPAAPGLWPLRESLALNVCLAHRPAGYSLGLCSLSGHSHSSLERDSARSPLTHFAGPPRGTVQCSASEYRSAPAWPHPFSIASHRIRTRQPS